MVLHMEIGVCTTDFTCQSVEALFDQIKAYGFSQVQFSFDSIGEEQIPQKIAPSLVEQISNAAGERQLQIVAVNGTFNIISPDNNEKLKGFAGFEGLAAACRKLGCKILTLCTGTKNPHSMWEGHPDNSTEHTWEEMLESVAVLVKIAEKYRIYLGVETEASNVVSSPEHARRLLDKINSPYLKIIMDCANLFSRNSAYRTNVHSTIKNAFDLLGKDIVLAHGKDILESPEILFTSTGKGIIDFNYFIQLLRKYNYRGGMILHGIKDRSDFPFCVEFIRNEILKNKEIPE